MERGGFGGLIRTLGKQEGGSRTVKAARCKINVALLICFFGAGDSRYYYHKLLNNINNLLHFDSTDNKRSFLSLGSADECQINS